MTVSWIENHEGIYKIEEDNGSFSLSIFKYEGSTEQVGSAEEAFEIINTTVDEVNNAIKNEMGDLWSETYNYESELGHRSSEIRIPGSKLVILVNVRPSNGATAVDLSLYHPVYSSVFMNEIQMEYTTRKNVLKALKDIYNLVLAAQNSGFIELIDLCVQENNSLIYKIFIDSEEKFIIYGGIDDSEICSVTLISDQDAVFKGSGRVPMVTSHNKIREMIMDELDKKFFDEIEDLCSEFEVIRDGNKSITVKNNGVQLEARNSGNRYDFYKNGGSSFSEDKPYKTENFISVFKNMNRISVFKNMNQFSKTCDNKGVNNEYE